jgi:hypothetical protein
MLAFVQNIGSETLPGEGTILLHIPTRRGRPQLFSASALAPKPATGPIRYRTSNFEFKTSNIR